jgi:hypothetical protein
MNWYATLIKFDFLESSIYFISRLIYKIKSYNIQSKPSTNVYIMLKKTYNPYTNWLKDLLSIIRLLWATMHGSIYSKDVKLLINSCSKSTCEMNKYNYLPKKSLSIPYILLLTNNDNR